MFIRVVVVCIED